MLHHCLKFTAINSVIPQTYIGHLLPAKAERQVGVFEAGSQ